MTPTLFGDTITIIKARETSHSLIDTPFCNGVSMNDGCGSVSVSTGCCCSIKWSDGASCIELLINIASKLAERDIEELDESESDYYL